MIHSRVSNNMASEVCSMTLLVFVPVDIDVLTFILLAKDAVVVAVANETSKTVLKSVSIRLKNV